MIRQHVRATQRLDTFTRAYIEAALFSTTDESDEQGGEPLDRNYGESDFAPETMQLIIEDCDDFQKRFGHLIEDDDSPAINKWGRDSLAGHDFWLTREGRRRILGWRRTEFELIVGDDGLIYGPNPEYYRNPPEWLAKRHPSRGRKRAEEVRPRPSPARHERAFRRPPPAAGPQPIPAPAPAPTRSAHKPPEHRQYDLHLIAVRPSSGKRHVNPVKPRLLGTYDTEAEAQEAGRTYLRTHPDAWLQTQPADQSEGGKDVEART